MIKVGEFREGMPLSELIQLAVNDARKAVATGKYVLDGFWFHAPDPNADDVCRIDLAGGIVAGIVGFDSTVEATHEDISGDMDFEGWETRSFRCLDYVRLGVVFSTWPAVDPTAKRVDAAARSGELIRAAIDDVTAIAPLETYEAAAQILAEVGL